MTAAGAQGRRRLLAQGRFALAVVLTAAGFILWLRSGFATPAAAIAAGPLPLAIVMLGALSYASIGLVLSLRRPEVRIGALEARWARACSPDRPWPSSRPSW